MSIRNHEPAPIIQIMAIRTAPIFSAAARPEGMSSRPRILLVEDSDDDAELIRVTLRREGLVSEWRRVGHIDQFQAALQDYRWDAVICDYNLPGANGLSVLECIRELDPDVPFILLSGCIGEEAAVRALKSGASDCVSKSNLGRLAPALTRALEDARLRIAHRATQEKLAASELRYRMLFDGDPLPLLVYDTATLAIIDVNQIACRMYGYSHEEFVRLTIRDIRPPDELPRLERWIRNRDGSDNAGIWRHRLKNGDVIDVEIYTRESVYMGRPARFVTPIDVTQRLLVEASVRKLSLAVQQSPAATVITDTSGRIQYVNPKFLEVSGYSADELIGKTPSVVKSGLTPPDVYAELWATIKSGATWRGTLRNRRRDGTLYWEDTSISPLMGEDGRIVNFIAVKEDITQRVEAEEALCRLNAELEERIKERTVELEAANRELEAFSSSVSHDLRAPLTSIQRFAEALLERSAPVTAETSRHYLERISAAGQRMQDLIDDLLGLARITKAAISKTPVDLSGLAAEVLTEVRENDPGRPCELLVQPGIRVYGDPALLRIVLTNLLGNAWKFSCRREVTEIEVGSEPAPNGFATFYVRDHGAGFDQALVAQMFAPFRRLHSQSEFPGTGVGLAIVRRIVERHGGSITAEGKVGSGAIFRVTLPQAPAA